MSDAERPTSWSKYEMEPAASLLRPIEKRGKASVDLGEHTQTAAAPPPNPVATVAPASEPELQIERVASEPSSTSEVPEIGPETRTSVEDPVICAELPVAGPLAVLEEAGAAAAEPQLVSLEGTSSNVAPEDPNDVQLEFAGPATAEPPAPREAAPSALSMPAADPAPVPNASIEPQPPTALAASETLPIAACEPLVGEPPLVPEVLEHTQSAPTLDMASPEPLP